MRKIMIVGAGQSGLHLAHGLLAHGYEVTVVTGRTSTELRTGRPAITQFTLPTALAYERELHLDFWSAQAPHIAGVHLGLYAPGQSEPAMITGRLAGYGVAVDRRVKMADWLEYFEDRGGKVVIHGLTVSDLDFFSRVYDLIVIAVGHGELGALFDPDPARATVGAHERVVAQALVDDVDPGPYDTLSGGFAEVASSAELRVFLAPILTQGGPAHALFLLTEQGGLLSSWPQRLGAAEQWQRMRSVLAARAPHMLARVKNAALLDAQAATMETVTPQVRRPVGRLPGGGAVLGLADVVVSTDPLAGQGWANSTACATTYLERILAHADRPFDAAFMHAAFDGFWQQRGQHAARLAEALHGMWGPDAPAHLAAVLTAAATYPEVADRFIAGLDEPAGYQQWLYDPALARAYLKEVAT